MDIINTPYWVFEFLKVLCGYLLVGFLWPRFVFAKHLSGKSMIYQFGFCVTVQTVLVNTVVLGLGLLHILNAWTIRAVFYGVPLAVLYRRMDVTEERLAAAARAVLVMRPKLLLERLYHAAGKKLRTLWRGAWPHLPEYLALGGVAVYALVYFSWGAFQTTAYSYPDQYTHHAWIYGLVQGRIFSDGVYPEAMHCLLYTIHTLLGVEVYSIMLFFGSIQSVVFLVSCYSLLRAFFQWRFTPVFALAAFVLLGTETEEVLAGIARLQGALPLEFALTAQMLCVLFLVRYLRGGNAPVGKGKLAGWILNRDLFVFMMSLAMLFAAHFHPVLVAFLLCVVVVLFHLKKVFSKERFLPLATAVLCGVLIALVPMAAGLASGIPMQASMNWALGIMDGAEDPDRRDSQRDQLEAALEDGGDSLATKITKSTAFVVKMVHQACGELLGKGWADPLLVLMAMVAAGGVILALLLLLPLSGLSWIKKLGIGQLWLGRYLLLTVLSLSMVLLYIMPYLGLPELILGRRLITTERIFLLAVAAIPLDMVFSILMLWLKAHILEGLSVVCLAVVCLWASTEENYHGYLYCDLTRYRAEVAVMTEIIQDYPQYSYTIVSPGDGLYHVAEHGRHEELLDFMLKSAGERYFLPTEHVFIFLEKKPLNYAQTHYANGPSWLARPEKVFPFSVVWSQNPEITHTEISLEASQAGLGEFKAPFDYYRFNRPVVESKVYYWCQHFAKLYPNEMTVYYEDEEFVCYYFRQEPHAPYDLAIGYEE